MVEKKNDVAQMWRRKHKILLGFCEMLKVTEYYMGTSQL